MSRNAVFDALFALAGTIKLPGGAEFQDTGRRLKMWDKAAQPALYQVEPDENVTSRVGQLARRSLKVSWVVYHQAGKDEGAVPSQLSSDILDAIEVALAPPCAGSRQTLGGLAYAAYIDGRIHKDSGDLDGQAMLIVPITILLP